MRKILLIVMLLAAAVAQAYTLSPRTEKVFDFLRQCNAAEAIRQLKSAAATNDVMAQYYMGCCYEHGIGMEADGRQAFGMFRRAAERGFAPAMQELARCYRQGVGIEANPTRAEEWEKRFVSRDTGETMPDIAEAYRNAGGLNNNLASAGSGNGNDSASAATPRRKAAAQPKASPQKPARNNPAPSPATATTPATTPTAPRQAVAKSDVDVQIPATGKVAENVFALIVANENYQDVARVPNALNDGEIFARYCRNALGLPTTNVHLVKDATLNNIKREINLLRQIASAYNGSASFIIYYAGHGIPDESTRSAFLMPVDGYVADLSTCYSLADLYKALGEMPSKKTVVFLDACFSGAARGDGMLASARGVAIKPKADAPAGNTVVMTSAQGDETAYPYNEKQHGMFTYYLLKKLKETRGNVTLGDLLEYVRGNVVRKSLVVNGKSQTPTAVPSPSLPAGWQSWKLN